MMDFKKDYCDIELIVSRDVVQQVANDLGRLITEVNIEDVPAIVFAGKILAAIYKNNDLVFIDNVTGDDINGN